MAEIRNIDSEGNVIPEEQSKEIRTGDVLDGPVKDPLTNSVEAVLGLENDTDKTNYSQKVQTILEWAKSMTEDHSPENIMWVIRDYQMKIGSPGVGEHPINYLYSYIGLMDKKQDIDSKLKRYNPYG